MLTALRTLRLTILVVIALAGAGHVAIAHEGGELQDVGRAAVAVVAVSATTTARRTHPRRHVHASASHRHTHVMWDAVVGSVDVAPAGNHRGPPRPRHLIALAA